jgi:hypothetical protein
MKQSSSGIGCLLLVGVTSFAALFQWIATEPAAIIFVIGAILAIIYGFKASKRKAVIRVADGFATVADQLEALSKSDEVPSDISLALKKGERPLFVLSGASLIEYQSTGSTYSGTNAGVSLPIVGGVRGYVGGSAGSINKNPEELMVVDVGTAVYTNQRIVFTGSKMVRDWEFSKVLSLDVGMNGQDVRIAVSNRDRTSGLQTPIASFGAGYPAGYAYSWFQNGEAAAKKWLLKSAQELRVGVENIRASQGIKKELPK